MGNAWEIDNAIAKKVGVDQIAVSVPAQLIVRTMEYVRLVDFVSV